jgi:hypothetical protein
VTLLPTVPVAPALTVAVYVTEYVPATVPAGSVNVRTGPEPPAVKTPGDVTEPNVKPTPRVPVQSGGLLALQPPTGSMTPAGAATVALLLANVAASSGKQASASATGTSHAHFTTLEIKRPMTRIARL